MVRHFFRGVVAAICLAGGALSAVESKQEPLGNVIAGTAVETQRPRLPASAQSILVRTCVYPQGKMHYWLGAPPAWHRAIPAAHPLNSLVSPAVAACPASYAPPAAVAPAPVRRAAPAPAPPPRSAVPLPSFELTSGDFKTAGLEFSGTFRALYIGNFNGVRLTRESPLLGTITGTYLDTFGRRCPGHLPANKVEITEQVCTAETVTRNGYGVEVSRYCSSWRTRGTGVYAEPKLYAAHKELDRLAASNAVGSVFSMMSDGGRGMLNMAQSALALKKDVGALVEMNGCRSRALGRFHENLRLFAVGERPVVISDAAPAVAAQAKPSAPKGKQNYNRLVDDLVAANARSWAVNRYVRGSASGASLVSTDADGQPRRLRASYAFDGFSGRQSGSVTVEFAGGRPKCLYFFDRPAVCRAPDRSIVGAYDSGKYATGE